MMGRDTTSWRILNAAVRFELLHVDREQNYKSALP